MADLNEIEDAAAGMAAYGAANSLFRKYGTLNVLFWSALILVILGLTFLWVANSLDAKEEAFTWTKVKSGDKLYVDHQGVTDTALNELPFLRLVRPMTAADIDKLKLPLWKKKKMIAQLDTSTNKEARMVASGVVLIQNKLFKYIPPTLVVL